MIGADSQRIQVGDVIATLRARLHPTCATLVEQLKAALEITHQRFIDVGMLPLPGWHELIAQHWIVFDHFDPIRMAAVADADVVAAYGELVQSVDRVRPTNDRAPSIAEQASVAALEAVSCTILSARRQVRQADGVSGQLDTFAQAVSRQVNPHWSAEDHTLTSAERERAHQWFPQQGSSMDHPQASFTATSAFDPAARVWPMSVVDAIVASRRNVSGN